VEQSDVEPVVRGPKESFVEVIPTNIGMIRRRIHSPNLVFEQIDLGCITETKICIVYIKGICSEELSNEVRMRIKKIKMDGILESSYIEEQIQDSRYSLFPQIRTTERPDSVAASLLEGRAAIIVDNTPVVMIAPGEFFSLLQSAEDYYNRYSFSSLVRLLRFFAFTLALILPAVYIAVVNYHQEMIPTSLLASIVASRSNVPLPAFLEALSMEITFEILREAGVRLPRQVGQAVSIVGALVIGQAAVQASIVSPLMVIVVALTGISSFCIPQYSLALPVRVMRFALMILAAMLGLFGVMIGILFLMMHLFSIESFGKPYMAPIGPLRASGLKDTVLRYPWWSLSRLRTCWRK
jgi:spore germination protein KA